MVQKIGPDELNIVLKFGGGLHTRASADEIDARESAGGQNFSIDIQNRNLNLRPPFDLIGTAPNGLSVNGGGSFVDNTGTTHAFIQAGGQVYRWNGGNSFTSIGSCSTNCKLRGHWKTQAWPLLPNLVLITDLTLTDPIYQWDGTLTGFKKPVFTDQNGNPFGNFYAKYLSIQKERAMFANVADSTGTLPHLLVGCEVSNFNEITTVNQPSSSIGTGDPFFMPMPDLKPINGFLATYLGVMLSTEKGQIFNLQGTDATNFAFATFYANSAASGNESVCEIGNDFIYGRQGRIESVRDTNTFGNSEADDLTAIVADQVAGYTGWTIVFNTRTRKTYCFPTGVSEVWCLDAAIRDLHYELTVSGQGGGISPWQRWRTAHSLAFKPTFVASMLDPADGLEYIIMGDGSGNIYRMEGTGAAGDGGSANIDLQFLTKLISAKLDSRMYDIEGYVKYYPQPTTSTLTLTFKYQGTSIFSNSLSTTLAARTGGQYWGSGHWNDGSVWNQITGQLTRNKFIAQGMANEFQLLIEVNGTNPVSINEIGIRMRAAS